MDLIILQDELYTLIPVTKKMLEDIKIINDVDCFDLCEILRLKLSTYIGEPYNYHIMNDGSGYLYGCICK
jgi:hypothetical protein